MMRTPRWGITLPLHGSSLAGQREIIGSLAGLGYTDAWTAEVNSTDAFIPWRWRPSGPANCGSAPLSRRCTPGRPRFWR